MGRQAGYIMSEHQKQRIREGRAAAKEARIREERNKKRREREAAKKAPKTE